jgi:hypothetical protein
MKNGISINDLIRSNKTFTYCSSLLQITAKKDFIVIGFLLESNQIIISNSTERHFIPYKMLMNFKNITRHRIKTINQLFQ